MERNHQLSVFHDESIEMDKYESDFQKEIHDSIKVLSPWPTSYDVDSSQESKFSEFSYTDCLRGFFLNTQSVEMNCRLMQQASNVHCSDFTLLDSLKEIIGDKYVLEPSDTIESNYEIGFMVGQNMFDIVSCELVARLAHEKDNFYLKLHPLTEFEHARKIAFHVGWHRIIRNDVSAYELMKNADIVHTSTASELTLSAVITGKPINNISNFFNESSGVYYSISKLLYTSDDPRQVLNNIINCEFSGLLLPGVKNPIDRIKAYYDKALELRDIYGNLASKSSLVKGG